MFQAYFRKQAPLDPSVLRRSLEMLGKRIFPTCPESVWVFGSVARGEAHEGSDIDLLLVYAHDQDIAAARDRIYGDLSGPLCELPADLLFVTKDEFLRKSDMGGVCLLAKTEGKPLQSLLGDKDESQTTLQERVCS